MCLNVVGDVTIQRNSLLIAAINNVFSSQARYLVYIESPFPAGVSDRIIVALLFTVVSGPYRSARDRMTQCSSPRRLCEVRML